MRLNPHHRGFSLVELVTSLAIISILMVAMGSAVVIATRGLPDPNSPFAQKAEAAQVVGQLADELVYATTILKMSPTGLQFVVDRNGKPITIFYSWSGTPGDPLIRAYNGSDVKIIENVQDFTLTYNLTAPDPTILLIEGPEELFIEQDGSNSGTESEFVLTGNNKCAEKFQPVLPADAVSWRITRIQAIVSPSGSTQGSVSFEVWDTNQGTGKPNSRIDSASVPESELIPDNWHEVQFSSAGGLSPSEPYFILFRRLSGGGTVGILKIGTGSLDSPETTYWSGQNFQEDPTTDIWLWVWGKVTAPDPNPPPPAGAALSSVQIEVQVGPDTSTKTQTAVQVLNAPDVSGL